MAMSLRDKRDYIMHLCLMV